MVPPSYQLVLFLEQGGLWFHEAAVALARLSSVLTEDQLQRLDVLLAEPEALACVVHLDPRHSPVEAATLVAAEAATGMFRCVDLMHLTLRERESLRSELLPRFRERQLDVRDLPRALQTVRDRLDLAVVPHVPWGGLELPVSWRYGSNECLGVASRITSCGAFIATPKLPNLGDELALQLGQMPPFSVNARVLYTRPEGPGVVGFGVGFVLAAETINRLESFLIAASRGTAWPERSGRLFERFPLRMSVEYEYRHRVRHESTANLSRGGVFIETDDPPAVGSELTLRVHAPASADAVELRGTVVRTASAIQGRHGGVGVQFTELPAVVASKVGRLLGGVGAPSNRRALVADDDRFFRTIIGHNLKAAGYQVIEATSADEALARAMEELIHIDVLVVDLYMPGMQTTQLIDRVRRVGRDLNLAIVVLTGAELLEVDRRALLQLGADLVLPKALQAEELLSHIEVVRKRRHLWLANPASLVLEALRLEQRQAAGRDLSESELGRLAELRSVLADDGAFGVVRRERRKYLWLHVTGVTAELDVAGQLGGAPCCEISVGGVYLAWAPPPPLGTRVLLRGLSLDGQAHPLDVAVIINETQDEDAELPAGVRGQFADLDAEARARVHKVFALLRERFGA